jgi:hypothetical protein
MIRITNVQGDVIVDDQKLRYRAPAHIGMTLSLNGDYLIVTTPTSRAEFDIDGQPMKLGPSSFLRVRGNRSWWQKHGEPFTGDVKLFVGKVWARVARERPDDGPNVGVGVRG